MLFGFALFVCFEFSMSFSSFDTLIAMQLMTLVSFGPIFTPLILLDFANPRGLSGWPYNCFFNPISSLAYFQLEISQIWLKLFMQVEAF